MYLSKKKKKHRAVPGSEGRSEVQGVRPSVITGPTKWVTKRKQEGICIQRRKWGQDAAPQDKVR